MIHNLHNNGKVVKRTINNFKENIILLFKKYFKLKSLAVYEKNVMTNIKLSMNLMLKRKKKSKKKFN